MKLFSRKTGKALHALKEEYQTIQNQAKETRACSTDEGFCSLLCKLMFVLIEMVDVCSTVIIICLGVIAGILL